MGSLGFPELDLVYSNVIGGRRCGGVNPNGIGSILWVEVGNHVKDSLPHQTGDILKRPSNIRKLEF